MITLVALIILICSLAGMGIITFRKIPALLELPETSSFHFNWKEFFSKIRTPNPFKRFSNEIFLQKILSKIRILTLKTDNKTSSWLQKLREKAQKKKSDENDKYWKEIKKNNHPTQSKK